MGLRRRVTPSQVGYDGLTCLRPVIVEADHQGGYLPVFGSRDCPTDLHCPIDLVESMPLKLFSAIVLCLTAVSTSEAAVALRQSARRLQTYTQLSDYEGPMLERVNQERSAQGLPALCSNSKLQQSAQRHSDDQATHDFMNHTGSDGSSMAQRITEAGYDWRGVAENVAAGQVDVNQVMDDWMNSEGHRHNILGDYTMLGVAYAYTPDGLYHHFWTQDFGRSDTEQCDDGTTPATSTSSPVATSTYPPFTTPSPSTSAATYPPFITSSPGTSTSTYPPFPSSPSSSGDDGVSTPNGQGNRGTSSSSALTAATAQALALHVATLLLLAQY
jgi:uncharacterized protein YkwD